MQTYADEMENEDNEQGRLLASVNVNPNDFAKLQRAVTSLVYQSRTSVGKPAPYKHSIFWHSKFRHDRSSEYVLEVNKDEMKTDEEGRVIETIKVALTDDDVNEAFISYLTNCHTSQIAPFLSFQFERYYNSLKATQSAQPFFECIMSLADIAIERDLLYKSEANELIRWIVMNPHYTPSAPAAVENTSPAEKPTQIVLEKSVPALALMYVYLHKIGYFGGMKPREKLMKEEALKHQVSPNSLYIDFNKYNKDENRLVAAAILHIEKAIELLKVEGFESALNYAKADLETIKSQLSS